MKKNKMMNDEEKMDEVDILIIDSSDDGKIHELKLKPKV